MKWALIWVALTSVAAQAQHHDHAHHSGSVSNEGAHIVVTINPEARVSAVVSAPMPLLSKCGEAAELKVQIDNRGFVTAPLRAAIIGDARRKVVLHMEATKLTGGRTDTRLLHLVPIDSSAFDVTVAFSIDNNIGDLGGRDRVHLLLRCDPGRALRSEAHPN